MPDWVYEEEVFSADSALWWAPDASKLAFLAFDETAVDEYTFPVCNASDDAHTVVPYPGAAVMKYPKPGYSSPLVSVHVFQLEAYLRSVQQAQAGDAANGNANTTALAQQATLELDWGGRVARENSVTGEVTWVGADALLVKEVTREAEDGHVVYFDLARESESGQAGWQAGEETRQGRRAG